MKLIHSIKGTLRIAKTASLLSKTGIKWLLGTRPPAPELMRETFEQLGTTYIKLGQFIASSPSLFPESYVTEFQKCLDSAKPIPFSTVKILLKQELKKPIYEIFSDIDPTPLATASIAQVHAAKLITGEDVVIKVQKPGVEDTLLTDLNFLFVAARVIELLAPQIHIASLSEVIDELQKCMLEECDFSKEAANIADFQKFLDETNNTSVIAPKVYQEASSLRVLTMERLFGISFTDLDRVKNYTDDPQFSLITAMNTWFATLLMGRPFHADVHAGNLLVLKDGRIGFIDFGIVGKIRMETWSALTQFIQSITENDHLGMAQSMVGIGITKGEVDIDALASDIKRLYDNLDQLNSSNSQHYNNLNDTDINQVMTKIIGIGKRYGIHFPREFALLLKQILYFDRYVQLLAPNGNFYADQRLTMIPDIKHQEVIEPTKKQASKQHPIT